MAGRPHRLVVIRGEQSHRRDGAVDRPVQLREVLVTTEAAHTHRAPKDFFG